MPATMRPIQTRFRCAYTFRLKLAANTNSRTHYTKGTPSPPLFRKVGLRLLVGIRFQVSFTPLVGVLFTFPSRYLCTIGRQGVFRLGGWSPHVQTGFHVPRPTQGSPKALRLRGCHPLWPAFPDRSASLSVTTGLLRFRSPLLAESLLMSFPPGTEMFQFPGFASRPYEFRPGYPKGVGFPIRTSADQRSLASPRGFSQRATSFIASWRQGIHRMPFSHSILSPPPAHRAKPRPVQLPLSGGSTRSIPRARSSLAPGRCASLTHTTDHLHHVKEHARPARHPAPHRGSRTTPQGGFRKCRRIPLSGRSPPGPSTVSPHRHRGIACATPHRAAVPRRSLLYPSGGLPHCRLRQKGNGDGRIRTDDPLLAKQVLSH